MLGNGHGLESQEPYWSRLAFSDLDHCVAFVVRDVKTILLIAGYFWKRDPDPVQHTVTICPTQVCTVPSLRPRASRGQRK